MNRNGRLITFGVFFASLAVFSLARSRFVSLSATGTAQALLLAGDEPAYLMLTHSLATDGDFNLYNNCLNRDGRFFGREQSGGHAARKDREKKEVYSIHTPGLAILLAPAYALGLHGPIAPRPAVCLFLNFIGALLAVNVYWYCAAITSDRSPGSAARTELLPVLASTAAVVLTPPVLFYSNLAYPELPGALFVLYALRHTIPHPKGCATISPSRRHTDTLARIFSALAAAFLPWLSFRFLAPAVIIIWLLSRSGRSATRGRRFDSLFPCVALAVSLVFLLSYQYRAFGTIHPAGGYVSQDWARRGFFNRGIINGLLGIILDQGHGIFAWSPVYILSFTGLLLLLRERRDQGVWLLIVLLSLYLPGASFIHWWGGFAPPPRFMVVSAPLLGGALCYALLRVPRRSFSIIFALLLCVSLYFGYVGCMHPSRLYRHQHIITTYHPRIMSRIFPSFMRHRRSTWPLTILWGAAIVLLNGYYLSRHERQKDKGASPVLGHS
jgi:hypothetical protein